jgi:hypothetical protein
VLVQTEPVPSSLLATLTGTGGPEIKAMFCTWRCAAEYATVKALVDSTGTEGT